MRTQSTTRALLVLPAILALSVCTLAQVTPPSQGPDVIVGDLPDVNNYGSTGNIAAFSVGTTSCNIGTQVLLWQGSTALHPVIAQNIYRLKDDRFEQVGMSWLKHGFTALNGNLCNTCNPTGGSTLGIGCSDPYSASLNGQQANLGARSEVNAATGVFPYPPVLQPPITNNIQRRIQVNHSDLDPAQNPGALYFIEGHYVTPDDASAGNQNNNAAYREIAVNPNAGSYDITLTGATQQQQQAIMAWQNADPSVIIEHVDVPGDGRFTVGFKVVALGNGTSRYEYAIHNMNSDRAAKSVSVSLPASATVTGVGFHDIDHHSGEPWSAADWTSSVTSNGVQWTTDDITVSPQANALRWGTLFNFWFTSDAVPGALTIELFKPGTPTTVTASSVALCPAPPTPQPVVGYTLAPSPAYDFTFIVPVSQSPPALALGQSAVVPLGFDFPFFDTVLNDIEISPSGYLTLVGQPATLQANQILPDIGLPNGVIAGYWDDLDSALGGVVRHATLGTAPNRRFVCEWTNVPHTANPLQTEHFQISLYETGRITTSWVNTSGGGAGATIGIESPDAGRGNLVGFNQAGSAVAGTSVQYDRQLQGLTTAALNVTGTAAFGTPVTLNLTSVPLKPLLLLGDRDRGPTFLGPQWAPLDIGFGPLFIPVFDGVGLFRNPDPGAVTDGCGLWSFTFVSPLPSGFDYTLQAIVVEQIAGALVLQVSNSVRLIVP